MNDLEKAQWVLMGCKARKEAVKLDHRLGDFDLFKLSFGFYKWKTKNKATHEQLACFEAGWNYEDDEEGFKALTKVMNEH